MGSGLGDVPANARPATSVTTSISAMVPSKRDRRTNRRGDSQPAMPRVQLSRQIA